MRKSYSATKTKKSLMFIARRESSRVTPDYKIGFANNSHARIQKQ